MPTLPTPDVTEDWGDDLNLVLSALMAERAHPLDPDVGTLHATYGDDFTGSDINTGKWNRVTYGDADEAAADSWLTVQCRTAGAYYWQTAPAGNWTLTAKFQCYGENGTSMFGLMAVDNSGVGVGFGPYNASPNAPMIGNISGGAYTSGFTQCTGPVSTVFQSGIPMWLRLTKSGTSYTGQASFNGVKWGPVSAAHSNSTTITRIGFGQWFSSGVKVFDIDYFNVT